MVGVNTIGQLVLTTLATSIRARSKDVANGEATEIFKIVTLTKESTSRIENMVKVFLLGPLETFTKETMSRMKDVETAKCFGQMGPCMRENG